ncbi:MAG: hypothetical protein E6J34_07780 [Chloroflexi bacterium]|nr:MAG: hypothetical protein E6J34_07780 [Chloroflexota bacterium]
MYFEQASETGWWWAGRPQGSLRQLVRVWPTRNHCQGEPVVTQLTLAQHKNGLRDMHYVFA